MDESKSSENEPIWAKYVGTEVGIFSPNGPIVIGKMNQPNIKRGYVDFIPSLVNEADDKRVRVETKRPTTISLDIIDSGSVIIRPLSDGYIVDRAEYLNRVANEKDKRIGFNSS